jgi:hypothetical protein
MHQPSDDLKSFAALKGWPVTAGSGQLFCRGREAGVRWHVWTNPPALAPSLTMVAEIKSGLSFEIVHGPQIRPGTFDFEIAEDPDGRRHFVKVSKLSPEVQSWIDNLEPAYLARLALGEQEELSVHPETVAIEFQANGLAHALERARTLLDFATLLPKRKAHTLPKELRPIAPLIRMWSISDDAKREARLAAASRPDLEGLVSAWRGHLDLLNATIEQRPTTDLSVRLMAFSQAAQEAELQLSSGRET